MKVLEHLLALRILCGETMKFNILTILSNTFFSFIIITSCGKYDVIRNPNHIFIGQNIHINIKNSNFPDANFYLTNEGFDYEIVDDSIILKSIVTFNPVYAFSIMENEFLAVIGIEYGKETKDDEITSSRKYNVLANGFDIFDTKIDKETKYIFCFPTKKTDDYFELNEKSIFCHVFEYYHMFNCDNQKR